MASPTDNNEGFFSDVRKVGYLRKPKSMHKRFFVLRAASESGPARLEYYENEKKWRHKSGAPKRSIPLESCFNINKRADSKNKHLVALYTKDEHFAIAADSEPEQESWYQALLSTGLGEAGEDSYGEVAPGPAFKEVWQVILKPKGLGQTKNLIGIYRLCLTNKTISFVKLNSDAAAVVLQLLNIRRCGHSENFFFIEVGRSAGDENGDFGQFTACCLCCYFLCRAFSCIHSGLRCPHSSLWLRCILELTGSGSVTHRGSFLQLLGGTTPVVPHCQNPAHKPKTTGEQMWICCGSCFWGSCEKAPQMSRGFEDELLITCVLSI
uniref:PH domain-containing protein n=1 Tax=Serinus canaria TaxID=9135 RepID=A0A8C9MF58_SERCA